MEYEPFGDNQMKNIMRNELMKNHYSKMTNIKSDIGSYMNKKPPLHIKNRAKIGRAKAI